MFGIINDEEDPIQVLRETHTNSISLDCICEYSNISNIFIDNIPSNFSSIPLPRKVDFSNVTITVTNTTKDLFLFLYDNKSSLTSVGSITKEMTTTGNYTESIVLPYNYMENQDVTTFPRSLKFVSRGGVNTVNNPVFGTTEKRPLKPHIGQMFFDTSLNPSKYICWNGTNWVNLDGTSLSSVEHE